MNIKAFSFFVILVVMFSFGVYVYDPPIQVLDEPNPLSKDDLKWELDLKAKGTGYVYDSVANVAYVSKIGKRIDCIDLTNGTIIKSKTYSETDQIGGLHEQSESYLIGFTGNGFYIVEKDSLEIKGYYEHESKGNNDSIRDIKITDERVVMVYGVYTYKSLDIHTLKEQWSFHRDVQHMSQNIYIVGDEIYIRGADALLVLDLETGALIKELKPSMSYPFLQDGNYLYGLSGTGISKLNLKTFSYEWIVGTELDFNLFQTEQGNFYVDELNSGNIYSVDKANGELESVISTNFGRASFMFDISDHYLLILNEDDKLIIYNKANGKKMWGYDSNIVPSYNDRVFNKNEVFIVVESTGRVRAFDAERILESIQE